MHLEHAACPLLLEALEERPNQVIDVEQLKLGFHQRLQDLREKPATSQAQRLTFTQPNLAHYVFKNGIKSIAVKAVGLELEEQTQESWAKGLMKMKLLI